MSLDELAEGRRAPVAVPAGSDEEPLGAEGAIVRSWEGLAGSLAVSAERLGPDLHRLTARIENVTPWEGGPREAALRETEEAIGVVLSSSEPVELSPQTAYIRRLQHQMAERANLVSRSRGREPYRRVRLYPDAARTWR